MPASDTPAIPCTPAISRTIVLVGLMGAGKSCIGRLLAPRLHLPFRDADHEIENAAGCSVAEIFRIHGEEHFRDGERRVIGRLLEEQPMVLATGGGAFMDPGTRSKIAQHAVSVWLRADLELLLKRTSRRKTRPLLNQGDPRLTLQRLIGERYPVYGCADLVIDSEDAPPEETADRVEKAVRAHLAKTRSPAQPQARTQARTGAKPKIPEGSNA